MKCRNPPIVFIRIRSPRAKSTCTRIRSHLQWVYAKWANIFPVGTNHLVTRSTRHTVKSCDELTVMSDGVVTSWPYFLSTWTHVHVRYLLSPVRLSSVCLSVCLSCLSVVCNIRAPYSGSSNFQQYFYGIRYLSHPLISTENLMEIVPGEPLHGGS